MPKQRDEKTGKIGISWTDFSCNLWWGCQRVSPSCDKCYAESLSKRFGFSVWGKNEPRRFFGDKPYNTLVKINRTALKDYGRPARVFINSMSDTFEDRRDLDQYRQRLWDLVPELPDLELLLLTKRIEAVHRLVPAKWMQEGFPPNVRLGTTVESQQWADLRIKELLSIPANNFLSVEPLFSPLNLHDVLLGKGGYHGSALKRETDLEPPWCPTGVVNWVIVGCESGPQRRRMHDLPIWTASLAEQCRKAGTSFFVKQLEIDGKVEKDINKFPQHLRVQQFPKQETPA